MNRERWTLIGVFGVIVLAIAWIAWGHAQSTDRNLASGSIIGVWDIVYLDDSPPRRVPISSIKIERNAGEMRAYAHVDAGLAPPPFDGWPLIPVIDDATSWDTPEFRIVLRSRDEIELTGRPGSEDASDPPWRARGTRRQP